MQNQKCGIGNKVYLTTFGRIYFEESYLHFLIFASDYY